MYALWFTGVVVVEQQLGLLGQKRAAVPLKEARRRP
jgi:hypothetical protein